MGKEIVCMAKLNSLHAQDKNELWAPIDTLGVQYLWM